LLQNVALNSEHSNTVTSVKSKTYAVSRLL